MATWSACYAPIIAKSPTEEQDSAKAAGTGVAVFTATPTDGLAHWPLIPWRKNRSINSIPAQNACRLRAQGATSPAGTVRTMRFLKSHPTRWIRTTSPPNSWWTSAKTSVVQALPSPTQSRSPT